jgi:hypothetical protein
MHLCGKKEDDDENIPRGVSKEAPAGTGRRRSLLRGVSKEAPAGTGRRRSLLRGVLFADMVLVGVEVGRAWLTQAVEAKMIDSWSC